MTRIPVLILKWLSLFLLLLALLSALTYVLRRPQQDREWIKEQAVLPQIIFQGDDLNPIVTLKNVRDFRWQSDKSQRIKQANYQEIPFQLSQISELKAVVSHFSAISEIAHVFLIFVLDDGREFGISIEARREVGESFSIQGGLFAQFELMMVLATPADLLGIREVNQELVHVYPIKVEKTDAQRLFRLIAEDVNQLYQRPAFYHIFLKNCTNQLVKHVSTLTDRRYPWFFQTFAPGDTAEILFELNLIDLPDTPFSEIQNKTRLRY